MSCAFSSAMKREVIVIVSPIHKASINHAIGRYESKLDTPKLDG